MKRLLSLILAVLCIVAVFSGCQAKQSGEPYTLRIFVPGDRAPAENDPIMKAIGERLNMKIEVVTAPWGEETTKQSNLLMDKEAFDIIEAPDSSVGMPWAEDGLLMDIGSLIKGKEKDYPYINSVINAESFAGLKIDGKAYYVAGTHHGEDWSWYIRQDWLDNLGLSVPTNAEEFYNVCVAFRDKDPDKNGKNDTIAYEATKITSAGSLAELNPLIRMFGGTQGGFFEDYIVKDGKVTAPEISNASLNGFKFINKMYREGLINSDFMQLGDIVEANAKYLYADKAGIIWTSRIAEFEGELKKVNPNAKFTLLNPIADKGTEFLKSQGTAWWLLVGIPKTSKNPEKALQFIEFCNSEEGRQLLVCGVKDVHYTSITNGVYDQKKEAWEKDFDTKVNGYDYPLWWGFLTTTHGYIPTKDYPTYEEAMKNIVIYMTDEQSKEGFNWQTSIKNGALYNEPNAFHSVYLSSVVDMRNDIQNNVKAVSYAEMVTAKSEDEVVKAWEKYVANWKAAGGEQVLAAYQEYYDKNLK